MTSTTATTWSPMRNRLFAILILTNLVTQLGVFMNGLGGAWILTDLTDSPSVITLLQVAVSVPTFLLALFTGALADIVDRKKLIVFAQGGIMTVAGVFAVLSASDAHTTATVLGLTAIMGILSALSAPAWLAIIPGLVGRKDLAGAMTLSSAGISAAMAVGPAIGGFVIAAGGPTYVFLLNVIVFGGGLIALRSWKPASRSGMPGEHLLSAVRGGIQYVRYDRSLKVVIAKIVPFALVGTALVSLLPAIARFRLDAGPALFGLISGAGGIGAVIGLLLLPRLRKIARPDAIVFGAMMIEAGVLFVLSTTTNIIASVAVLVAAGAATLAMVSTVMTVLQVVLPAWIRGRGGAVYLLVLQAAFAVGALVWGAIAERSDLSNTLRIAAIAMVVGGFVTLLLRVNALMDSDTEWAQLAVEYPTATSVHDSDGPIIVTAMWELEPGRRDEFIRSMQPTRRALQRQGALNWRLAEDVSTPGRMVEAFTMATWAEFQRLPERATSDDRLIEQAMIAASGSTEVPALQAFRVIDVDTEPDE